MARVKTPSEMLTKLQLFHGLRGQDRANRISARITALTYGRRAAVDLVDRYDRAIAKERERT